MPLKDILVHLDTTARSAGRLELAIDLARRHDAHLTALHVVDIGLPLIGMADGSGGAAIASLVDQMREDGLADARRIEATFRERLRQEGLPGEWRVAEGMVAEMVTLHARYADLVILGQDDPDAPGTSPVGLAGDILFGAGRPVLVVPYAGKHTAVGRRVLIGWNASREAARAVNDALPLIASAESATVLAANPRGGLAGLGEEPGADIALHLARHGATVTVEHHVAPSVPDADLLLNHATDMTADLIVMGAYGHSRLREFVLGGVTRTILKQMTVPVLMSH
ncbi:universal stress protein [Roseomonas terrae]|jgi:nucleotide-binding universal stress UspA family protein|uniref:Universal stress protein n=1 Tax=Neoroseomonas terrae TaxID=424799 RepID=A0ABS5EGA0_9PROT|nr:universal stress protein [Neoroseomonas terrae]MBR0650033.1 universal stress protein [Neoroseomonas terrae]